MNANLLDLIGADVRLTRVASTAGGEWAGPCPLCGGSDRLRVQPERGRWWCRRCSPSERWSDAVEYVRRRHGLGFRAALERLGDAPASAAPAPAAAPVAEHQPAPAWRAAAAEIVRECATALWSDAGHAARDYLHERGIQEQTATAWSLGYNGQDRTIAGLWVEAGIILPWHAGGALWSLKIRRRAPGGRERYTAVRGSVPLLYGADRLAGRPQLVLCEGELDALLLWQEAADLAGVATLGSARPAVPQQALPYLLGAGRILVAYDNDPPGRDAAAKLVAAHPRMAAATVPQGKDVGEFWRAGGSLRDWLSFCLAARAPEAPPLRGENPNRCDAAGCGLALAEPRDPEVGGWCLRHWDRLQLLCLAATLGWPRRDREAWRQLARTAGEAALRDATHELAA